jgi:predicted amidophosphoribosyltransferase
LFHFGSTEMVFYPKLVATSKRWLERGLHQILPRVCSLCELNLEGDAECAARLCWACAERLPGQTAIRCLRCGLAHLATPIAPCALDAAEQFPWDAVITWVDYDYPVDGWIHALKFQRDASLAYGLGWGLAQAVFQASLDLQKRVTQLDALIPLPLSRERLAKRGFNQAQLIAQSLQSALRSPALQPKSPFSQNPVLRLNVLKRIKDGPAMSLLASEGRHHLVKGAYTVMSKAPAIIRRQRTQDSSKAVPETSQALQGLRLGLIDDVMTTGATLAEATRCLKAAGALEVIILVAARTPK